MGGMGGQAHVPSFLRTSILNFISMENEFCRAKFKKNPARGVSEQPDAGILVLHRFSCLRNEFNWFMSISPDFFFVHFNLVENNYPSSVTMLLIKRIYPGGRTP
jgi:hypothetical protein